MYTIFSAQYRYEAVFGRDRISLSGCGRAFCSTRETWTFWNKINSCICTLRCNLGGCCSCCFYFFWLKLARVLWIFDSLFDVAKMANGFIKNIHLYIKLSVIVWFVCCLDWDHLMRRNFSIQFFKLSNFRWYRKDHYVIISC